MRDTPDSFVNQLGPVPEGIEVGVVAASRDRMVQRGGTELDGQKDHITAEGWHTAVLWTRETADLTERFLRTGSFATQNAPSAIDPRIASGAVASETLLAES